MTCIVAQSRRIVRMKKKTKKEREKEKMNKKKRENDCPIMHLENLISLNKSQESQVQKNAEKL